MFYQMLVTVTVELMSRAVSLVGCVVISFSQWGVEDSYLALQTDMGGGCYQIFGEYIAKKAGVEVWNRLALHYI